MEFILSSDLRQLPHTHRVILAVAASFCNGVLLYSIIRPIRKRLGAAWALVAAAPILLCCCCIPHLFSDAEVLSRAVACLLTMFMASLKVLGLCCNRGALAARPWTPIQFVLLFMLPIQPQQERPAAGTRRGGGRSFDDAGTTAAVAATFGRNFVLLVLADFLLLAAPGQLPLLLKYYLYALCLATFLTVLMAGPAAALLAACDLHVVPPFDAPWAAASLADFWGRRWNNTISLAIRALTYEPIMEGCLIRPEGSAQPSAHKLPLPPPATAPATGSNVPVTAVVTPTAASPGPQADETAAAQQRPSAATSPTHALQSCRPSMLRRVAATFSTFLLSGLLHELCLLMLCGSSTTYHGGWWFAFFLAQAPLLLFERQALRALKAQAGVRVPWLVGVAYTTAIELLLSAALWYPPIDGLTDLAPQLLAALARNLAAAATALADLGHMLGLPVTGDGWAAAAALVG